MKSSLISGILIILTLTNAISQNPYKYETKVEIINTMRQTFGFESNLDQIEKLSALYNNKGYKLIQMNLVDNPGSNYGQKMVLVYEKSDSYREVELYKLINDLTSRIDNTTKKYIDSAKVEINTSVLNYLKSIPNDVITLAYKDELTKKIILETDEVLKKVVEELKKEIRNSSAVKN